MKKLIEKDKKTRKVIKSLEKKVFILKMMRNNPSLSYLVRLNASYSLKRLEKNASKTFVSNRCIATVNKKKFSKWTNYSRIFFLKLVKANKIYGMTKASW